MFAHEGDLAFAREVRAALERRPGRGQLAVVVPDRHCARDLGPVLVAAGVDVGRVHLLEVNGSTIGRRFDEVLTHPACQAGVVRTVWWKTSVLTRVTPARGRA